MQYEKNGNNNEISDGVNVLLVIYTDWKTKQSKMHASFSLVGLLGYSPASSLLLSLGKALNGIASTLEWLDW